MGTSKAVFSKWRTLLRELVGLLTPAWVREHAILQILQPAHLFAHGENKQFSHAIYRPALFEVH
jgi:hypothetical protein